VRRRIKSGYDVEQVSVYWQGAFFGGRNSRVCPDAKTYSHQPSSPWKDIGRLRKAFTSFGFVICITVLRNKK
jgi:hypothetical protein